MPAVADLALGMAPIAGGVALGAAAGYLKGPDIRRAIKQDITQAATIGGSRFAQRPVSVDGNDQVVDAAIDAALELGSPLHLFRW